MKYPELLQRAEAHINRHPSQYQPETSFDVFNSGGRWMQQQMELLDGHKSHEHTVQSFSYYGYLKYGICLAAFIASLLLLSQISIYLTPLAVLVFYGIEVHFLFLFPLIIDGAANPIC